MLSLAIQAVQLSTYMNENCVIPCRISEEREKTVREYTKALLDQAHMIGDHGLEKGEFHQSGLFRSAVERIRGTMSASMKDKREFVKAVLDCLVKHSFIVGWKSAESTDRHDYEVEHQDRRITAIETKGCLDGNNTNIFVRPPNADEFVIWSLCQNAAADPRHNAWSGIHTRLGAEMIVSKQKIDALIIWDMLCGTIARPCPKLASRQRATDVGPYSVPPPCVYLFPRTIPDPRNNPVPDPMRLADVSFASVLYRAFRCQEDEIHSVRIRTKRKGADLVRQTCIEADNQILRESAWTRLRRSGA